MRLFFLTCFATLIIGSPCLRAADNIIQLQDLQIEKLEEWNLHQDVNDGDTLLMGFENSEKYFRIYVKKASINMRDVFVNQSRVIEAEMDFTINGLTWRRLLTSKQTNGQTRYISSFYNRTKGFSYYGYAVGDSREAAVEISEEFLNQITN